MTFFANLESSFRPYLRHIELRQYVKKDAKTALVFLSEAKGLEHLRIELGVANDDDPDKAALAFWSDVCKLLDVVGSRIAKSKVPPRKIKLPEAKVEEESEEDEESEEEDEEEDEDEDKDESEDDETEKTDESVKSVKSDPVEAKDSKDEVAKSDDSKDSKDEVAKSDDSKDAEVAKSEDLKDTESVKVEGSETGDHKSSNIKTEENTTADGIEKTSDPAKTDSKSPAPVAPVVKKKATTPEPPQLIQGQKCFAVDILNFGKSAFKNKNGTLWDNKKKEKFLTILEGKLK
jgi:DNA polymerase III gamma/tau subunit